MSMTDDERVAKLLDGVKNNPVIYNKVSNWLYQTFDLHSAIITLYITYFLLNKKNEIINVDELIKTDDLKPYKESVNNRTNCNKCIFSPKTYEEYCIGKSNPSVYCPEAYTEKAYLCGNYKKEGD